MTDPERFRMKGSELERRLFASMEDDAPPPAARARMLAALGASAVLSAAEKAAAATATSKGAPGLGWLVIAKWMAAGAATALVTVGTGVVLSTSGRASPPAPVSTTVPAPSTVMGAQRAALTALAPTQELQREGQERTEQGAATARERPGTTAPARVRACAPASEGEAPRSSAVVTNTPPPASNLAREVAILDDVQRTLDRGDPRGALGRLDLYAASFPAPSLGPEATLLRVQALLGSGDRPGAEALGQAFIAHNPRSQHAERIQRLFGSAMAPAGRLLDQSSRSRTQPE